MADLPLPEEMVGPDVTEEQFKDALVRLIAGIKDYLNEHGNGLSEMLEQALDGFINTVNGYKQEINNRVSQYPFNEEILFDFADAEDRTVMRIKKDGAVQIVGVEESIQKTFSDIFAKMFQRNSENIFDLLDSDNNIVLSVTKDSKLLIPSLNTDVASAINNTKSYVESTTGINLDQRLFTLTDANNNIVAYFDLDSKFYIPGVETDIASAINNNSLSTVDTSALNQYSYRDSFVAKGQNLLNFFRNSQNLGLLAPVPLQWTFQNFSISKDWINNAKVSDWGSYIPVNTPYGVNRGVVHPHILEVPNNCLGYRYILTITGYTNGNTKEENPFLLGSNDLQKFDLLTGLIDEPDSYAWEHGPVYNSDCFTFYDHKTSELCLMFRTYWADTDGVEPNLTYEKLFVRRTKDGKNWSEREAVFENYTGSALAPAVIFDAKTELYHLYVIGNTNGNTSGLQHFTSKTLNNNWQFVGTCTTPTTDSPWHADLKIVGDKIVCTYQNRVGQDSVGFRLGISDDFHNFNWASDWWNPTTQEVYKATFLPQLNDQNQLRLVFLWTSNHKPADVSLRYKLYVQPTPFLDVNFLET